MNFKNPAFEAFSLNVDPQRKQSFTRWMRRLGARLKVGLGEWLCGSTHVTLKRHDFRMEHIQAPNSLDLKIFNQIMNTTQKITLIIAICTCCHSFAQNEKFPQLYERLGGIASIRPLIERLTEQLAAHPQTKEYYQGVNLKRMNESISIQMCQLTGGPCNYTGDSMSSIHKGMSISTADFQLMGQLLIKELEKKNVAPEDQKAFIDLLLPMAPDIIGRP